MTFFLSENALGFSEDWLSYLSYGKPITPITSRESVDVKLYLELDIETKLSTDVLVRYHI